MTNCVQLFAEYTGLIINAYVGILESGSSTTSDTTYWTGELPDQLFRKLVTVWPWLFVYFCFYRQEIMPQAQQLVLFGLCINYVSSQSLDPSVYQSSINSLWFHIPSCVKWLTCKILSTRRQKEKANLTMHKILSFVAILDKKSVKQT